MDKVREREVPLPGNDKEDWGNHWDMKKKRRGEEKREKKKGEKKKEEKRKKKRQKLRNLQRKRKSMVMINLNQAKLVNEEKWIEIEQQKWGRMWRKKTKKKTEEY